MRNSVVHTLTHAALAAGLLSQCLPAQDNPLQDSAPIVETPHGFHIYSASVYWGYASTAYPTNGLALNNSSAILGLGPDQLYGGEVTAGWERHRGRTNISLHYSGGYSGMIRYSDANGWTHALALDIGRQLTARWTATVSGWANDGTLAQYLFRPEQLTQVTQQPMDFSDFAAALSVGQFSNAQIASMLTGAPILESPAQSLVLGDRILSYSGQAGVSFAYSSRLNFHLSSMSAAGESRLGSAATGGAPANYVMPRSIGATGGAGFSYMLTPRTTIGLDADEYLTRNRYQDARSTTGTFSVGRKMSERWLLRVYGGGSLMRSSLTGSGSQSLRQVVGGGTLGVKVRSQSLAASYDRSSSDSFGFAAGLIITETGSWHWQRPGSRWSAFAGFGQEQMRNTGFASISGWRATGGAGIRLSDQSALQVEYAHLQSGGTYAGFFNQLQVDSIRLSLSWMPAGMVH